MQRNGQTSELFLLNEAELSCTLLGCVSKLATTGLLQRSAARGILAQWRLLVSCHARQKQEQQKRRKEEEEEEEEGGRKEAAGGG